MNNKEIKLTGLWALSESMFGGFLHLIKIPFKGIYLSNAAVLIITFITKYSSGKRSALKSSLIVNLIKGSAAPHTPPQAYLSVFLQGVFGNVILKKNKINFINILLFAVIIALLTGLHKIIVLTVLFGESLWNSLNELFNHAAISLGLIHKSANEINFSLWIIIIYIGIHLICGIAAAYFINYLNNNINTELAKKYKNDYNTELKIENVKRKKKKSFLLITISILLIIISFLINDNSKNDLEIILVFVRALSIIMLWIYLVAPFLNKIIHKYFSKNKSSYSENYLAVQNSLADLKNIISFSWETSDGKKLIKYINFMKILFSVILFYEE